MGKDLTLNALGKTYQCELGEDTVIFGDKSDVSIIKPCVELSRWSEDSLSIKLDDELEDVILTNGVIDSTLKSNKDIGFYANKHDEEKFKFGLVFYKKPASNIFDFQLDGWEGFNFYFQKPLANENPDGSTWETNGRGLLDKRPADVNGSYAVYHKTKKNNKYKTGKFCHIYRPKFIDANGSWVWGDLDIKEGAYKITIDQKFLDKAVYPVKANDTFGRTSAGGSYGSTDSGYTQRSKATTGAAGNLTSITAFLANADGSKMGCALYLVNARLAYVEDADGGTISGGQGTTNISYVGMTASTVYFLGMSSDDAAFDWAYDNASDGDADYKASATWTDPYGADATEARLYSIYGTYTAGGGSVTGTGFMTTITKYWG